METGWQQEDRTENDWKILEKFYIHQIFLHMGQNAGAEAI
jgi:hypothetical protein